LRCLSLQMNPTTIPNVLGMKGFWRFEMSPLLLVCIAAATPVVGIGWMHVQARLEQWDYERHAED
jgi:hypothetical protein